MNKSVIKRTLLLSLLCGILIGCDKQEKYFTGSMKEYEMKEDSVVLQSEKLTTEPLYSEWFAVKDSLLFCFNPRKTDCAYYVFNIRTGKLIGSFLPYGHGNNEFIALPPILRFDQEGNDTKTFLYAPAEGKVFTWNISQSIQQKKTVIEDVRKFPSAPHNAQIFSHVTRISKDSVLAYTPSIGSQANNKVTLPRYYVLGNDPYKILNEIAVVKENLDYTQYTAFIPERYFASSSCTKPDGSKFVEIMHWFPQLNIVDIASGKVESYRMKIAAGSSSFDLSKTDPDYCYHKIAANEEFIFALWGGATSKTFRGNCHWIHVFDWEGRFLKRIYLKDPATSIWLDDSTQMLYTYNMNDESLMRYDLTQVPDLGLSRNK